MCTVQFAVTKCSVVLQTTAGISSRSLSFNHFQFNSNTLTRHTLMLGARSLKELIRQKLCFDASIWVYLWGEKSFITMSKLYVWNVSCMRKKRGKILENKLCQNCCGIKLAARLSNEYIIYAWPVRKMQIVVFFVHSLRWIFRKCTTAAFIVYGDCGETIRYSKFRK